MTPEHSDYKTRQINSRVLVINPFRKEMNPTYKRVKKNRRKNEGPRKEVAGKTEKKEKTPAIITKQNGERLNAGPSKAQGREKKKGSRGHSRTEWIAPVESSAVWALPTKGYG